MEQRVHVFLHVPAASEIATNEPDVEEAAAELSLEYAKENYFSMFEHGIMFMTANELASASVFEQLLRQGLSEIEIGRHLAAHGYTYPAEEMA